MSILDHEVLAKTTNKTKSIALSNLEPGTRARVATVDDSGRVGQRLQEMGIVPGVILRIVKTAPFGDPVELLVLGYKLALRKKEAAVVLVDPI